MTIKTKRPTNGVLAARRVMVKGKRMVMLDEASYEALLRQADLWETGPAHAGRGRQLPGP